MLFRLIRDLFGAASNPPSQTVNASAMAERDDAAYLLYESGDLSAAKNAYAALLEELDPATAAAAVAARFLADIQCQLGEPAAAAQIIEPVLAEQPDNLGLRIATADIIAQLGRHDEALGLLVLLPQSPGDAARPRLYRARSLRALGRLDEALPEFRGASLSAGATAVGLESAQAWIEIAPGSEEAAVVCARSLAANGFNMESNAYLEQARIEFPKSQPLAEAAADVHAALGHWQAAATLYRQLCAELPADASMRCRLGQCHKFLGELEAAIEDLDEAVSLDPSLSKTYLERGLTRFELGHLNAALEDFRWAHIASRGTPWNGHFEQRLAMARAPAVTVPTARHKLAHDAEQLYYLSEHDLLPETAEDLADLYSDVQHDLPTELARLPVIALPADAPRELVGSLGQPMYIPLDAVPSPSPLNAALNRQELQTRYHASSPEIMHVDDFLEPDALAELYQYCLHTTTWNHLKTGYLGAYLHDGFCSGLLLRLASNLREQLPEIFGGLELSMLWGYKYDSERKGIGLHADQARVNLNFWLTPDEANLDPDSGGLVVYPWEPPPDWGSVRYNRETAAVSKRLKESSVVPVVVPYRCNRAVIFNSKLFHHTDQFRFQSGYESRRINITMLFGHG